MQTGSAVTIGILADDLTSAADGAAPFVARGLQALIGRGRLPSHLAPVVAIDGGMRSLSEADAGLRTAALIADLAGQTILYKTVDSTLRGHVRVELQAALTVSGRQTLVFAPAFPAAGRTTVAGVQLVDGQPVAQSVYGRDPVHPARHSVLTELVPTIRAQTIVLDAETQDELDRKVAAVPDPETILWVGSPGLASALARRLAPSTAPKSFHAASGEILLVIGTANPRSHAQAAQIHGIPGVAILRSPTQREADPVAVLHHIADEAAALIHHGGVAALVATGGDTMDAILARLGVDEFDLLDELEPGFPLGRVDGHDGRPLLIAMKAGGFGDDRTLRRAIAQLRMTPTQSDQG